MAELTSALESLGADDLHGLPAAELLERTAALVRARNSIDAELARTVRAAEPARAPEHDGLATMRSWLRGHARLTPSTAGGLVRAGDRRGPPGAPAPGPAGWGNPGEASGRRTTVALVVPPTDPAPRTDPPAGKEATPRPAPWGPATGVGSLPGVDPAEALRLVTGELPDFPHLPELPARGAGADLVGRSAALLVDLAVELTPAGWQLAPRGGADQRRARDLLARDLDALHEVAAGYAGPWKVQAAGPWTLAAGLERPRGERAVVDPGARRDLGQSLAEGLAAHVAAVTARVPGARLVVQLDEPSLPAVLQGALPTVSGFGRLPAVEAAVVEDELGALVSALPVPVVLHCCADRAPLELLRSAGAAAVSFDLALVQDLDALGTAVEAGTHLLPGVVPGTDATLPAPKATASRVQAWWRELGFSTERLPEAVTLTPSCGLAGATPAYARAALTHVREAARYLQPD